MKIIFTGDWHFGENGNSLKHNNYLQEFIEFMVDYAHQNDIREIVQTGDYFDVRDKIDVRTLNFGIKSAKWIQENFKGNFTVISGNHDMYLKNSHDFVSVAAIEPYCELITENTLKVIGGKNVLFTPWITDAEHWDKTINQTIESKVDFIFGHFEFSGFKMNDHYVMEHGQSHRQLKHVKKICTGHYHGRQTIDNVVYAGSPFPFDMNDANDSERGFAVLDTDTGEVEFVNWEKVKIVSLSFEKFKELKDTFDEHTTVRIEFDDDSDNEKLVSEAQELLGELNIAGSKIKYRGSVARELINMDVNIEEVENIDMAVIKALESAATIDSVDKSLLIDLYKESKERSEVK